MRSQSIRESGASQRRSSVSSVPINSRATQELGMLLPGQVPDRDDSESHLESATNGAVRLRVLDEDGTRTASSQTDRGVGAPRPPIVTVQGPTFEAEELAKRKPKLSEKARNAIDTAFSKRGKEDLMLKRIPIAGQLMVAARNIMEHRGAQKDMEAIAYSVEGTPNDVLTANLLATASRLAVREEFLNASVTLLLNIASKVLDPTGQLSEFAGEIAAKVVVTAGKKAIKSATKAVGEKAFGAAKKSKEVRAQALSDQSKGVGQSQIPTPREYLQAQKEVERMRQEKAALAKGQVTDFSEPISEDEANRYAVLVGHAIFPEAWQDMSASNLWHDLDKSWERFEAYTNRLAERLAAPPRVESDLVIEDL